MFNSVKTGASPELSLGPIYITLEFISVNSSHEGVATNLRYFGINLRNFRQ